MNVKKILIVIIALIVVVIFIVFFNNIRKKENLVDEKISNNITTYNISESPTGSYTVKNRKNEDVITNSLVEAEWYQSHPEYDPEPVHVE